MKNKDLVLQILFSVLFIIHICPVLSAEKNIHAYGGSNCGPDVLKHVCAALGLETTEEELAVLSGTVKGNTTMLGLLEAARHKGLEVIGIKTDIRGLKRFLGKGYKIISFYSKNYHYAAINAIHKNRIYLYDPAMFKKEGAIPVGIFKKNWTGEVLVLARGRKTIREDIIGKSMMLVLDNKSMEKITGGDDCANTNGESGSNGGDASKDPVILNNGNLITNTNDIYIPGKLPLEITRTYNAQIVTDLYGWTPTSSWTVGDGEYRGQGDYSIYNRVFGDLDLELDMKTIEPGARHMWEVCSVSFRYADRNNRYYFTIHTTGKIELAKFQNGAQFSDLASKEAGYNPLDWNHIRITAVNRTEGGRKITDIRIYVNDVLELEYTDRNPILAGNIMIESYFCYGVFDNISISDGSSVVYNNDFSENANGWRLNPLNSWYLNNGEYCSDSLMATNKAYSENSYSNFTLQFDMQTRQSNGNPWEVAWINIRRFDDNNLYYFNIQTNGKIELVKKKDGATRILSELHNTGYNPFVRNRIKITAVENRFRVYINNRRIIDVSDANPVSGGAIVLEAFRCNASFDNITVRDGAIPYENDFDSVDDSDGIFGRNITFNYGWKAKEFPDGSITIVTGNGRRLVFQPTAGDPGRYISPRGIYSTLTKDINGYYMRSKYGIVYTFDIEGRLTNISDPNNNRITISYDLEKRPVRITDSYNRHLDISYNTEGKIDSITDPAGRTVTYNYNENDCLIRVTNPRGNSCTYTYYPNYNLSSFTDTEGYTYQYTYYYNDRIYQQTDPDGNITTFDYLWDTTVVTNNDGESYYYEFYEENDKIKTITDFLGYTQSYVYNNQNNLIRFTDKNGSTTTYEYDNLGNRTRIINPLGEETRFIYEPTYSKIVNFVDVKGSVTAYEYNAHSNLTGIIEPAPFNYRTVMTYNEHGNPITKTDSLNRVTNFEYDDNGYLSGVIDPLGSRTEYNYDNIGRLISVRDADQNMTAYEYDRNNNITRIIDASGNETINTYNGNDKCVSNTRFYNGQPLTTAYEYNWAGKITRIINPAGMVREYIYNLINYMHLAWTRVTDVTNGRFGENMHYSYDIDGRLASARDALGNIIQYAYDDAGNLVQIIDADNDTTAYTYNRLNQLLQTIYPDGTNETNEYDPNGNIAGRTDRRGNRILYEYDSLNRRTSKRYPDESEIEYTYTPTGKLSSVSFAGETINYTYDNADRVIQISYSDGKTINYEYDAAGRLVRLTYPDGTAINYVLDELRRVRQIKNNAMETITEYTYDSLGRKTARLLENGTQTIFTYNNSNDLTELVNQRDDNSLISSFSYTYDPVSGNRTSLTGAEGICNYAYDSIYQLTSTIYQDGRSISYTYDNLGNRLRQNDDGVNSDGAYNNLNQLTRIIYNNGELGRRVTVRGSVSDRQIAAVSVNGINAGINGDYFAAEDVPLDEGENQITAAAADQAGNISEDTITVNLVPKTNITYEYDANGNLTTKNIDGEITSYTYGYDNRLTCVNTPDGTIINYRYDPFGRRIEKNVNGIVTKYIHSGAQIINEGDNNGAIIAAYIYGIDIDEPIVMRKGGENYYYYHDGLGSITEILDERSSIIEKYKYTPFGETKILNPDTNTIRNKSAIDNPYMYTARQLDEETGLYYYRNRYYSPDTGRFTTADPIGYRGGLNLYRYCNNNPINWRDPWGLITVIGPTGEAGGGFIDPIPPDPDPGPIITPIPPQGGYEPPGPQFDPPQEGPMGDPIPPVHGNDPITRKPGEQRQIDDVAREFGLDPHEFGDYLEENKKGKRGDDNFTYQELRELARELKESKGGKCK